jgi:hypothetical protein
MHIARNLKEVVIRVDQKGLVSPLIEMSHTLMPFVEGRGVGDIEVSHEFGKVSIRRGYQQVEMVGHAGI